MNKKFSTLVASLLLTSAFTVYSADAKPMLANPTQVETRAAGDITASGAVEVTKLPTETVAGQLAGFTNNSRLVVYGIQESNYVKPTKFVKFATTGSAEAAYSVSSVADAAPYYWSLDGNNLKDQNGNILTIAGEQQFEIVPVVKSDANTVKTSYFVLKVKGQKKYVKYALTSGSGSLAANASSVDDAALFASVETAYSIVKEASDLNALLGEGFEMTVKVAKGNDAVVLGTDALKGELKAEQGSALVATYYSLKNAKGEAVVFDPEATIGENNNTQKGAFKTVKAGEEGSLIKYFQIKAADNGSEGVQMTASNDNSTIYSAYISTLGTTNYLTASTSVSGVTFPYITLTGSNTVDLKTLLTGKFVRVSYVKAATVASADKYKVDGILSVTNNGEDKAVVADYVAKSSVVANAPEAQWALTWDGTNNGIVLTNRENKKAKVEITTLRTTNEAGVYEVAAVEKTTNKQSEVIEGDLVTIEFVENHTKTDGFMVATENQLRNTTYYLGQHRTNADGDINVYWAENHGTHQIGGTVSEEEATKWNLELVQKASKAETDTVFIVSDMNVWANGVMTAKKDTLAVLPYAFQNRGNLEYVKKNGDTNLEYYICDEDNLTDAKAAQKFALKMKPDGTYNYVAIDKTADHIGTEKVYNSNSIDKGTWKNMLAYDGTGNSLMFVQKVDDPEYRKIGLAWGDTIKLYRAENESQVVYEQRDDKSVVNGETLSFLNIQNDNDPKFDINPAIFADTAYVNRGENTCWQYLLAVQPKNISEWTCPYNPEHNTDAWREANGGHCADAVNKTYVEGRFLVNLIDTANIYGKESLHNNPYINKVEANENLAKLAFVEGKHVADTLFLYTNDDTVKIDLSKPDFNVAKFAFRYVDNEAGTFKIQTAYKEYKPENIETLTYNNEGYLRWVNGCIVVTDDYTNGDVFNMTERYTEEAPTANEEINANGVVSVVAENGAVVVKGAEGKNVIVSTILGKVVANEVLTSDNAKIAAPAGIVVVSVDGESFKVVVK